jgi:hypothetical protein
MEAAHARIAAGTHDDRYTRRASGPAGGVVRLGYTLKNTTDVVCAVRESPERAKRERWSRDRLEAFQRDRVGALVEHASTHSPF